MMIFIMSLNRYFAILKPFTYKKYFTKSNIIIMVSLVAISSFLCFLVLFAVKLENTLTYYSDFGIATDYSIETIFNYSDIANYTYYDYNRL